MNNKRSVVFSVIITFILTVTITLGGVYVYQSGALLKYGIPMPDGTASTIRAAEEIIDTMYYEEVDKTTLYNGAVKGMLEAIGDEYTWYVDEDSYENLSVDMSGEYTGIGVTVTIDAADRLITVISPIEDTPAYKFGIKPGDKILSIDSVVVSQDNYQEAINIMRGSVEDVGKNVELVIKRAETGLTEKISLVRERIVLKTVKHKKLPSNIGYIRITSFDEKTHNEFKTALDALSYTSLDGLVIDLRNNGGGTLTSMQEIADILLPEGIITYFEYKDGRKQYFRSTEGHIDIPLSIIINGSSASASEALSGAVRDHGRGTLVGEKSFGKGIAQSVFPFAKTDKGMTAIYLTTAKYYTPAGECIHKIGITPDIVVSLPEEFKNANIDELTLEQDTQLKAAWENLLK